MMQLIPYNQEIYFNLTQVDAATLATISLVAFVYHPLYSNLLYLLFCIGNPTNTSLHLLARDSNSEAFIQNTTLFSSYDCSASFQIKATEYLFLVESSFHVMIYSLYTNNQTVKFPILRNQLKPNSTYNPGFFRHCNIFADRYVIAQQVSLLDTLIVFGRVDARTGIIQRSFYLNLSSQVVVDIGLSQNQLWVVLSSYAPVIYLYSCLNCIYNNSAANNVSLNRISQRISLALYMPGTYRLYQGYTIANSDIENGKIYWGNNAGYSVQKLLINQTQYQRLDLIVPNGTKSAANHQYFITFGNSYYIDIHSFQNDSNYSSFFFYPIIDQLQLSEDSSVLAIKDIISPWYLLQYQIVQNCSLYDASPLYPNLSLVCVCHSYDSNGQCNVFGGSSSPASSLPITAVIGLVAGLVLTVMSVIIIKKNYKRCTKGRRRTPWKYNPADLMSFEV